jgi:chorismate dehydratase
MILANIAYLNTAPYLHFMSRRWLARHSMVHGNPRQLGELARQGKVDAGVFSLIDAWALVASGEFEFLGDLGIAGRGPIQSILYFGPKNPKDIEGKAIAVTPHTATTSRLMEIWLKQKIGVKGWTQVSPGEKAEATLLIGDDALTRKLAKIPGDQEPTDLSQAWTDWTGLPFVFARWAVRKSLPEAEKRDLLLSLISGLDLSLDDLEAVAAKRAEDTAFEPDFIQAYLKGILYRIGPEEEKGMALFKEKLDQL